MRVWNPAVMEGLGWAAAIFLLLGALAATGHSQTLARAHYRHDGPALLPDGNVSRGQVSIREKSKLCPHAETTALRNVTDAEKKTVCAEYGIAAAECTGANYEIDHIISLELGGSNDISNLFPQPFRPAPGAHEKDQVENWLHARVCSGGISLYAAQRLIARDWYRLYVEMEEQK
jgi:hypothetical protein